MEAKLQAYVSKKKILGMRVFIRGNGAERLIPKIRHSNLPGEAFAPWGPACRWETFLLDEGLRFGFVGFGWLRASMFLLVEGIHRVHPRWWGFNGHTKQRYGFPSMDEEAFH